MTEREKNAKRSTAKRNKKSAGKRKHVSAAVLIAAAIPILALGSGYAYGVNYYGSHFYAGTEIEGIDAGGKSESFLQKKLEDAFSGYELTVTGKDTKDVLKAEDIHLHYVLEDEDGSNVIQEEMEKQNAMIWPYVKLKGRVENDIILETAYDEQALEDAVDAFACVSPEEVIGPQEAGYAYQDGQYVITEASGGNTADRDRVLEYVKDAIASEKSEISVMDCYEGAPETEGLETIRGMVEEANQILASDITVKTAYHTASPDADTIQSFLILDEEAGTVDIDRDLVYEWVNDNISGPNYTIGAERTIQTPSSGTVSVSGGTYGMWINVGEETDEIISELKEGATVTREPVCRVSEVSEENGGVGNDYIDVDITNQTVYLIKDGKIDYSTPCVTGLTNGVRDTPTGTYYISWKTTNWTMVKYDSFVYYWMPIDDSEGIGLHDATWRSSFGGNIYKTNGSHGCINLPYEAAKYIYNHVDAGIPVIVH